MPTLISILNGYRCRLVGTALSLVVPLVAPPPAAAVEPFPVADVKVTSSWKYQQTNQTGSGTALYYHTCGSNDITLSYVDAVVRPELLGDGSAATANSVLTSISGLFAQGGSGGRCLTGSSSPTVTLCGGHESTWGQTCLTYWAWIYPAQSTVCTVIGQSPVSLGEWVVGEYLPDRIAIPVAISCDNDSTVSVTYSGIGGTHDVDFGDGGGGILYVGEQTGDTPVTFAVRAGVQLDLATHIRMNGAAGPLPGLYHGSSVVTVTYE